MATDKSMGRAEAVRQSMLVLIDKGDAYGASGLLGPPLCMQRLVLRWCEPHSIPWR